MHIPHSWIRIPLLIASVPLLFGIYLNLLGQPDALENLQTSSPILYVLLGLSGAFAAFTFLALWVLMILHWRGHNFGKQSAKIRWLLCLILLSFMGAIIYYLRVATKDPIIEA